ncbi:MAG: HEPN domain-containing protein [Armatimonadetes bacterium]|nr:HEPN domain-containing protein [Armatimonadota bacterium]
MSSEGWMSVRKLAEAYWSQARADYAAAVTLLDAGVYFASVFFAQQAAEQALKSAAIRKYGKTPRGHNLIQICNLLEAPIEVMNAAAELNPEFIATRSPEAANGVPAQNYDRKSARLHLKCAQTIVDWIKASQY